jgi:hypothetical protein
MWAIGACTAGRGVSTKTRHTSPLELTSEKRYRRAKPVSMTKLAFAAIDASRCLLSEQGVVQAFD